MKEKLKLGIPKGSLQDATIALFKKSGWKINVNGRSYFPDINDDAIECSLLRAQEMSINVERGILDVGLTGKDWIAENNSDVYVVSDLIYSKLTTRQARWVIAVAKDSDIKTIEDLEGKTVSTELVKFTERYFKEKNINVNVKFSWGATEAKISSNLADAIVEITETESTIRANNLKIIAELMRTNTQLIANKKAWENPLKRDKIKQIDLLLKGALKADKLVGLKMNVSQDNIETIINLLPSLNAPTVASLYNTDWFSVETVVASNQVRDLIPELLNNGAQGIIEYSLNKVL